MLEALRLTATLVLATVAALALAGRLKADRRTEAAAVTFALAPALIAVPVHVLGWFGFLSRPAVLFGVPLVSLAALGVALAGDRRALATGARAVLDAGRASFAVPWRGRSAALAGWLVVVFLVPWSLWVTYLAPSSAWDGVMYHDPMIGFALQNEGFAWVGVEGLNSMLGCVDGYPRMAENLGLYLVVATDRRWIEAVPSLMTPLLITALVVVFRRFGSDRSAALGFACALFLLPAVVLQLRSTYVDLAFLAWLAASLAFGLREEPEPADVWLTGLALGMVGASKVTGLYLVPLLGLVLATLVVRHALRSGRRGLLLHLLGASALLFALGAPTYVRNWLVAGNVVWPSRLELEALGIDWPGPISIANMHFSFEKTVHDLWWFPVEGQQYHDTRDNGYGNGPPFVVLPLAVLGLCSAMVPAWRGRRVHSGMLLAVSLPLLLTFAISPARHWARLNLHVVLAAFLLAAWFTSGRGRRLLAEGAVGALVVTGLMTLWWSTPAWDVPWERQQRLRLLPAEERAVSRDGVFTLMPVQTARARERELGPGAVVAVATHPFVGVLWNERFDNAVRFLDPRDGRGRRWVERAREIDATWAVVGFSTSESRALEAADDWEEVGPAAGGDRPTLAYRRIRSEPAAATERDADAP